MIRNALSKRIPVLSSVPQQDHDYAVQFGDAKRDYDMKAYPFFYNFIKSPYQIGTVDDAFGVNQEVGIYRVTADSAEGPDGLTILPGGVLDIPIVMDNDTNFHLLYAKYGAFRISSFTVATTDAGDTFAQPATDGMGNATTIVIDTLTGTTGPIVGQVYFVVNAGASTFQISLTLGGAAIALTTNGSAAFRRQGGVFGSREYLIYPFSSDSLVTPRYFTNPPLPGTLFTVVTSAAADTLLQPAGQRMLYDGMIIVLTTLVTTTGVSVGLPYYVFNSNATDFQLSLANAGVAIDLLTGAGTATFFLQGSLLPEQISNARIPYWSALDVSMYMRSSGDRDVYGGFQRQPIGGAVEETPLPILDLQGKQDGLGMLKTAFQLTRSATVWVRIRSRSAWPLQVYGHLFGYKITG